MTVVNLTREIDSKFKMIKQNTLTLLRSNRHEVYNLLKLHKKQCKIVKEYSTANKLALNFSLARVQNLSQCFSNVKTQGKKIIHMLYVFALNESC